MTPQQTAQLLISARTGGPAAPWRDILPADRAGAYAIQDATLAAIGPIAGRKVGAKSPQAEPHCAPLPASGIHASGVTLTGPAWRWRCMEVEVAFRLGRDLDPQGRLLPTEEVAAAFDAVLPAMEVVESRLAEGHVADPLAQLADLQCHGALVLGSPSTLAPAQVDLRMVEASLSFNGTVAAHTRGGNPAQDAWRLLAWLALHCAQRGQPLRAGQIVTTGSCTGMLNAPLGVPVRGEVMGVGAVELRFEP
ncbi:2-keto-4-pentenoate hydratase [Polaromonas sp. CF318]|uniref:2-keto-4-pentenoate hydratase n=1 Tax=Polaromonas sp. CF318 TaxID=1144318 RepID=UPI0002713D5F|nr:fumarylacetoacetate hydrolase family protein [Polaromonas sp. CF318]EJL81257.1 2-keto-4-pentenoate hydratase [Polaromonas sp. CF318]